MIILVPLRVSLCLLLAAVSASAASRPQFEVVPLSNGSSDLFAYPDTLRINNSNQITGARLIGEGIPHFESFLWQNGNVQILGDGRVEDINDLGAYVGSAPGSVFQSIEPSLIPHAINNTGQVVGENNGRAFLWDGNGLTYFPIEGNVLRSLARGVNNFGVAVGDARINFGSYHAFLFTVSNAVDIGNIPRTSQSEGQAINDQNHVALTATHTNRLTKRLRSYLYRDGQLTDLRSLPGKPHTRASAVNSSDEIVGFTGRTAPPFGTNRAFAVTISTGFLYSGGRLYNVNALLTRLSRGWHVFNAIDINDSGSIVALASRPNKRGQAVLLRRVMP